MEQHHYADLLIIGGGASGLAAAIAAKRTAPQKSVCILERNTRLGKKILITGNGRCNLSHHPVTRDKYYGSVASHVPWILSHTPSTEDFFASLGLYTQSDSEGRVYPYSNAASSVLDALRFSISSLGVDVACNCMVTHIAKEATTGQFVVDSTCGIWHSQAVIIATGGCAAPKTGSDGSLYAVLADLGHTIMPMQPALVPFYMQDSVMTQLHGVRVQGCVSAYNAKSQCIASEFGEIQFRQQMLSGICVMNLSVRCLENTPAYLSLDVLPNENLEQTRAKLWTIYSARSSWNLEDWLTGLLPKKICMPLLRACSISKANTDPVYMLESSDIDRVADVCHHWQLQVRGRGGWQDAQISTGGISSTEIDENLQSTIIPGLFFAGESLDVYGECGGYNLDWAWRSGQYVGTYVANTLL